MAQDVQQLWSGSSRGGTAQPSAATPVEAKNRAVNLWWYVMLFALVVALAETALASEYMGTEREEV
jgi:hypothetical protein